LALVAETIDPRVARNGSLKQKLSHLIDLRQKEQPANASITKGSYKPAADTLESAIGALFTEKGFPAAHHWIQHTFSPLIIGAVQKFGKRCAFSTYVCILPSTGLDSIAA
jgi:dsRNA-specific ribonuclease